MFCGSVVYSLCLLVTNRPLSLSIISEPLCNALRPGMVLKTQELVCLEWASRKSEWENSAILKSTSAITLAANHAAMNYYRIFFDESDVAFTDALIDQAHNHMVSKTIPATRTPGIVKGNKSLKISHLVLFK